MSVAALVEGLGLHTGARGSVRFERNEGPIVVRSRGADVALPDLRVVDTTRSTTVASEDGRVRVATIEHVLAALGGLGIHAGVLIVIDGAEAPLADGGARVYAEAVASLGVAPSPPSLRVVKSGVIEIDASRYELEASAAGATDDPVTLEVEIDFADARIATHARWSGDAADFLARIAPARTFGFERELADLTARGLASHVAPESVVVIGDAVIHAAGHVFTADEPARHKLLDLIGDLFLYGGPPRGRIRATRPGHAATHAMMRAALRDGLLTQER